MQRVHRTIVMMMLIMWIIVLNLGAQERTAEEAVSQATLDRLFQEGAQFYQIADYRAALEKWEAALEQARALNKPHYSSQLLMNIGVIYWSLGQYDQALTFLEEAAQVFRESGNRQGEAMILNNIGMIYQNQGRYAEALELYQQSLLTKRMFQDRRGEGNTLGNIANSYVYLARYDEALTFFEQMLAITRELGDRQTENVALSGIGWVYWHQGRYTQSLTSYERALSIARPLGDRKGESVALNGIGMAYADLGQYDQALQYYGQTLALKRQIEDIQGEGTTLNNIGVVYQNLGQQALALQYYEEALAIKQQIGDRQGANQSLLNIGTVYDDFGQYEQALEYYEQVLAISRELGERQAEGNTLNNIGTVHSKRQAYERALTYYEQALALRRDIGDLRGEMTSLNNLGLLYSAREQYERAAQTLRESLTICRDVGASAFLWVAQAGLASAEGELGKYDAAIALYEQALETIEGMRAGLSGKALKTSFMQNKFLVYDEFIALLQRLHEQYPDKGYARKAFEIFERKQGRVFLEEMGKSGARFFAGIPEDLLQQEQDLETRLEQIRKQILDEQAKVNNEQNAEHLKTLARHEHALTSEQDALQATIRTEHPAYHALKYPSPATLSDLQQQVLQTDEILLVYNVMQEQTVLWVIRATPSPTADSQNNDPSSSATHSAKGLSQDGNAFRMYALPVGEDALREKIADLRHTMMSDWGTQRGLALGGTQDQHAAQAEVVSFLQVSHELYTLLFPEAVRPLFASPSAPLLQGEESRILNIVPTGPLYALPFETLLTEPSENVRDTRYVIEDIPINYLSSASLLKTLRESHSRSVSTAHYPLLAFAHPDYSGEFSQEDASIRDLRGRAYRGFFGGVVAELPETADEARVIADLLDAPQESEPLQLRANASRKKVFELHAEERLDDYDYLLFAMHGVLPGEVDHVAQSALILSEGFLTMADVFGLQLNAKLVSLSACNTGMGTQIKGEGVMGLTRAFMYAGTPAVAVTLWSVESLSAKELDIGFFRQLNEGMSPAKALQTVKIDMLRGKYGEEYRLPYYWAPFVVFGDGK